MDENKDLVSTESQVKDESILDQEVDTNYIKLREIYDSMGSGQSAADESSPVDDLTSFFELFNSDSKVARYYAWDTFNIRGRQRVATASYGGQNYYDDNSEKKARQLLVKAINRQIRRLESLRYGYTKLATLYSFLIAKGLYGILSDLYIPEIIKPNIDSLINALTQDIDKILEEVYTYFKKYNNPSLDSVLLSLGRLLITQRTDQIMRNLQNYEPKINYDEDYEFLQERRSQYMQYADGPTLALAKENFCISDGSYYRNLDAIISDLTSSLDEDSIELLTDLFIRS